MIHTELEQAKIGIGARLWKTRKAKGITQVQLAKLARTNKAVIQKIEIGTAIRRIVDRLAPALQVNPAWIQWGEPFADKRVGYGCSSHHGHRGQTQTNESSELQWRFSTSLQLCLDLLMGLYSVNRGILRSSDPEFHL